MINVICFWINSEKTAKIRFKFLTWSSRQIILKHYQFSSAKIKFYQKIFIFNILISSLLWHWKLELYGSFYFSRIWKKLKFFLKFRHFCLNNKHKPSAAFHKETSHLICARKTSWNWLIIIPESGLLLTFFFNIPWVLFNFSSLLAKYKKILCGSSQPALTCSTSTYLFKDINGYLRERWEIRSKFTMMTLERRS